MAKTKKEIVRFPYGRGSSVHVAFRGNTVFTLLRFSVEFWSAVNESGFLQSVHENQIAQVLVEGKWLDFDPKDKRWKKIY